MLLDAGAEAAPKTRALDTLSIHAAKEGANGVCGCSGSTRAKGRARRGALALKIAVCDDRAAPEGSSGRRPRGASRHRPRRRTVMRLGSVSAGGRGRCWWTISSRPVDDRRRRSGVSVDMLEEAAKVHDDRHAAQGVLARKERETIPGCGDRANTRTETSFTMVDGRGRIGAEPSRGNGAFAAAKAGHAEAVRRRARRRGRRRPRRRRPHADDRGGADGPPGRGPRAHRVRGGPDSPSTTTSPPRGCSRPTRGTFRRTARVSRRHSRARARCGRRRMGGTDAAAARAADARARGGRPTWDPVASVKPVLNVSPPTRCSSSMRRTRRARIELHGLMSWHSSGRGDERIRRAGLLERVTIDGTSPSPEPLSRAASTVTDTGGAVPLSTATTRPTTTHLTSPQSRQSPARRPRGDSSPTPCVASRRTPRRTIGRSAAS